MKPGLLSAAVLFFSLTLSALAHDPGLSTAALRLAPDKVDAVLTFAIKDAEQLLARTDPSDATAPSLRSSAGANQLAALVASDFRLETDGKSAEPNTASCRLDSQGNAVVSLIFPAGNASTFTVHSRLLQTLPPGHRQYLEVRSDGPSLLAEKLLSADADSATVSVPLASKPAQPSKLASAVAFLTMGIEHILTGYDHLLFLFGLLVVTSRLASALKIITCFTVAHSITLAMATLSPVPAPAKWVEPLIAASIVYIGIENLARNGEPKGRWLLTFAFGLVHGCGFASALREVGVGANGGGIAVPLISFNLGVEVGQLSVAALLLPLLWRLRARPVFVRRFVPASSVLVSLLGAYWLFQRILT